MAKTPVVTKEKAKTYTVWAKFNGEEITVKTNDIDEAIKAMKPSWLHTEVYFTVSKGKVSSERKLALVNAKRVFSDDLEREMFINNLLLV
jgi:hypothetical protein